MNNEEAKFILQGYRPNGTDANDAAFRAALEQVGRDPALRDWFARQQAFDAAVGAKFGEVPPPAGLREAILAGGRVTESDTTKASWWRSPAILAAAASVAVVFATTLALWPKEAAGDTALAEHVLADVANGSTHMGFHGTESLQAMLGDPANRLSRGLPINFDALRKAGCRTVTFEGREVLEVCFNRGGIWFHAYIGRRADFPSIAASPAFMDKDGRSVATWADDAHVYLVASKAGRAALERLL
jgi:hypothetical protein